jgi:hypothetical protein
MLKEAHDIKQVGRAGCRLGRTYAFGFSAECAWLRQDLRIQVANGLKGVLIRSMIVFQLLFLLLKDGSVGQVVETPSRRHIREFCG